MVALNKLEKKSLYTIVTKHGYEFDTIHENMKFSARVYDYRVANAFIDAVNLHARLKEIEDDEVEDISEMEYLIFRNQKEEFLTIPIMAIDDIMLIKEVE